MIPRSTDTIKLAVSEINVHGKCEKEKIIDINLASKPFFNSSSIWDSFEERPPKMLALTSLPDAFIYCEEEAGS